MTAICRPLTGLGATMMLIGSLLAGCGQGPAPTSAGMGRAGFTQRQPVRQQPGGMFQARGTVGAFGDDADAGGDGDAPPAAAPPSSGGGLAPIARPTPPPAYEDPGGGGGEPTEVDGLYGELRAWGYRDTEKAMVQSIQAVTHTYPTGWDPHVDIAKHWQWWSVTIPEEFRKDQETYAKDALRLAQYRFDVAYFIWVDKQRPCIDPSTGQSGPCSPGTPPKVDFNQSIPIVKAIRSSWDDGWIVEISPRGTIVDFLQVPRDFLSDYNHFIPVPQELY